MKDHSAKCRQHTKTSDRSLIISACLIALFWSLSNCIDRHAQAIWESLQSCCFSLFGACSCLRASKRGVLLMPIWFAKCSFKCIGHPSYQNRGHTCLHIFKMLIQSSCQESWLEVRVGRFIINNILMHFHQPILKVGYIFNLIYLASWEAVFETTTVSWPFGSWSYLAVPISISAQRVWQVGKK